MPHAVLASTGRPSRCMRIETRLPTAAISGAATANARPIAFAPPAPAARSSGRNRSAMPATPSTAPASVRAATGVPNAARAPKGVMNTIVENTTATRPEASRCSAS
mgnify:CR=1 FL=1